MQGIYVVDKPVGPSSHKVVSVMRRCTGTRRVGHCGTLDLLASGVLILCVGRYTRLNEWLSRGSKEYLSTFRLGAESETDDAQGPILERAVDDPPQRNDVERLVTTEFCGDLIQVPPVYSAVHVNGERSYRRARRGEQIVAKPRKVSVNEFEVTGFDYPELQVRVVCSRGTYIRSLARDLGQRLGCGSYVQDLRRTRVGNVGLADSTDLTALQEAGLSVAPIAARRALDGILPAIDVGGAVVADFLHGVAVEVDEAQEEGERAVFAPDDVFLGVATAEAGRLQPKRVIADMSHFVES
ncbi:MAG: tRNA pseudouridine(55) synthase TruB [Candidatus Latescibacterota bacterium]|nr:tRNA pseudouridine(55) synthase TruB [Candidatus Latescibacterota bacterium]